MQNVKAQRVDRIPEPEDETLLEVLPDGYRIRPDVAAGTFAYITNLSDEIAALDYICPCGCGAHGCIPIKAGYGGDHWEWDGNAESPTLHPSILRKAGCKWHGYLKNGVWETCP